jgi:hypothetical protein
MTEIMMNTNPSPQVMTPVKAVRSVRSLSVSAMQFRIGV